MSSALHPSRNATWTLESGSPGSASTSAHHITLTGKSALRNLPEILERLKLSSSSPHHITHLCLLQLGLTRKQSTGLFAQIGAILSSNQTLISLDIDSITSEKHSSC